MTIIAFDGETLATDRQVTQGEHKFVSDDKAWYSETGPRGPCLISGVGPLAAILHRREWLIAGGDASDEEGYNKGKGATMLMIVRSSLDHSHRMFVYEDGSTIPRGADGCFDSFGSGAAYAKGAMAAGASATLAVKIANQYCLQCGLGVVAYNIKHKGHFYETKI